MSLHRFLPCARCKGFPDPAAFWGSNILPAEILCSPGPHLRGTGGSHSRIWIRHRDRGRLPTEGEEVEILHVFVSDESARHRAKAYGGSLHMTTETALPAFVVSQVPNRETHGAPIFRGEAHL